MFISIQSQHDYNDMARQSQHEIMKFNFL